MAGDWVQGLRVGLKSPALQALTVRFGRIWNEAGVRNGPGLKALVVKLSLRSEFDFEVTE